MTDYRHKYKNVVAKLIFGFLAYIYVMLIEMECEIFNFSLLPDDKINPLSLLFDFDTSMFSGLKLFLFSVIICIINSYVRQVRDDSIYRDFMDRLFYKQISKIKQISIPPMMTALYTSAYVCFSFSLMFYAFVHTGGMLVGNFVIDLQLQPTGESQYNYIFTGLALFMIAVSVVSNIKLKFDRSSMTATHVFIGCLFGTLYFFKTANGIITDDVYYTSTTELFSFSLVAISYAIAVGACLVSAIGFSHTPRVEGSEFSKFEYFSPIFLLIFLGISNGTALWAVNGNSDVMNESTIGNKTVHYRDGIFVHPENTSATEGLIEFLLGYPVLVTDDESSFVYLHMAAKNSGIGEKYLQTFNKAQLINLKTLDKNYDLIKDTNLDEIHMPPTQYLNYKITKIITEHTDLKVAISFNEMIADQRYQDAVDYIHDQRVKYNKAKDKVTDSSLVDSPFGVHSSFILFMIDDLKLAVVSDKDSFKHHTAEFNNLKKVKGIKNLLIERQADVSKMISLVSSASL